MAPPIDKKKEKLSFRYISTEENGFKIITEFNVIYFLNSRWDICAMIMTAEVKIL
jgi:hypothetical protein